jgi:flagellar assembly protein FliH
MTTVHKFLFDVSFDTDAPPSRRPKVEEPPPPPPPPTFSEAELEAVRNKARAEGLAEGKAEGFRQGRAKAEGEIHGALAKALTKLAAVVEDLLADRDALNADRTGQPLQIAMAMVGKLLPGLIARHGPEELEEFLTGCLTEAVDEPRLVIKVNEDLAEEMRSRIEELAAERGFAGRLVVIGDAGYGPSDARIEWANGGAERNTAQLLADIEQTAERLLGAGT